MEYMDVLVSLAAPFCLILTLHSWGPRWAWLWWSGGRHIWTTDPCAAEWSRCSDHILLYPYGSRQQIVNTCNRHISSHFKNLCISRTDLTTCKSNPFVILAITRNVFFWSNMAITQFIEVCPWPFIPKKMEENEPFLTLGEPFSTPPPLFKKTSGNLAVGVRGRGLLVPKQIHINDEWEWNLMIKKRVSYI